MSLGARIFLLLVPLVTALDSTARAVESGDFAGWSTSVAVARCIWSVAAQVPLPSCWWLASRVPQRIGASWRRPRRRGCYAMAG
jgi:hypothetical protein